MYVLQLIKFLKGFNAEERIKLAKVVAYCLANGLGSSACIGCLFEEHLVKDGELWLCPAGLRLVTEKSYDVERMPLERPGIDRVDYCI